ncbi:hypothetical protein TSMEX_005823 [Taenia solium]|eukprot:TsM_000894000 transcript=TsM_000894000 gene=TsM_000894000
MPSRYLNRDRLPPPEIGFKLEILNFASGEHGCAPYPEAGKFPMQPGEPSYPSGGMNTLSSSSTNRLTDYGDCDNFGSDVEDEENTSSFSKEKSIIIPSRSHKVDEGLHFLPHNVAKIQECRHRPVANGCEHQSRTLYVYHPTRTPREAKGDPRDRSKGAFHPYNG